MFYKESFKRNLLISKHSYQNVAKLLFVKHMHYRNSRPEVFCKKGVPKNFAKFTGKYLWQSPFFNKVATLLKKRLCHRCFPVNFAKFLRTAFCIEHLRWLLLNTKYTFFYIRTNHIRT